MNVRVVADYDGLSKAAAHAVAVQLRLKPDSVLGLPTGSSPVGMYKELVRLHQEEGLDFSEAVTFNLDEYLGLAPEHPQSYHFFMWENLFKYINIKPWNVHIPDGSTFDPEQECQRYELEIERAGGIDLQILGIGGNGHIGFNEPGTDLGSETHIAVLTPDTVKANSRFFKSPDEVPGKAICVGIKTIMRSRKIILIASGKNKSKAVFGAVCGKVDPGMPASILQLHPDAEVIVDEAGAGLLEGKIAAQGRPKCREPICCTGV